MSTAFPHAVELLSSGAGVVVPQRDPEALAARDPVGAHRPRSRCINGGGGTAAGAGAVVDSGGWPVQPDLAKRLARRTADGVRDEAAVEFDHLLRLSDNIGIFEHADHTTPRREHGYCVDDVARLLIVIAREAEAHETRARSRSALA